MRIIERSQLFSSGLGFRSLHGLRNAHRLHVLGAAASPLIDEGQLLPSDFHLVAMQQRGRFGTQAHAVDEDVGFWNCLGDDDLPIWQRFQLRVFGENTWNGERDGAAGIRARIPFSSSTVESTSPTETACNQTPPDPV